LAVGALRNGEEVVWVGEWRFFSFGDGRIVKLWRRFVCSDFGPVCVSRWDAIRFLSFLILRISVFYSALRI
jgi:hypothetical protein